MSAAIEEDVFSPEALDWFQKLSEGGSDLPPMSEPGDSGDRQYVNAITLSTAFYNVVKASAEEGLLNWNFTWRYTGFQHFDKINNQLNTQCLTPIQRSQIYKPFINYKDLTRLILQELVSDKICFERFDHDKNKLRMAIDFYQIADDAIDLLEDLFQRGARGTVRRMWLEQKMNIGIGPTAILPEAAIKARGYQEITSYSLKRSQFKKVFLNDASPIINKIGKPVFADHGIQLAPDINRLDLSL